MIESNHAVLWNRCLEVIKDNVPETTYNTWFAPIVPLKYEDKTLILQIPSQFFYEILEERFVDLIRKTLYKVIGEGTKLMYNVMVDKTSIPNQTVNLEASNRSTAVTPKSIFGANKAPNFLQAPAVQDLDPHLNPNYNFENFIEGYSNKLSRSVAEAVAQKPGGTAFNPLFLYGASGVGKTHLANAIGTKIKEIYPEKRVLYVSAHLFQVQYTDSVRNNTTNDFINFYQTIDVLIIDDIQEFAGVTKTQNNFFHIFNHLHQNGKQLILTSDRAPVLLQGIEERLLTRFKWGMVAELEKPTVELRKNILRNKIHRDGLQFPPEVIDYIAENVNESVRDLEGIVIAIMARSTIFNKEIDLDLAQHIVHGVVHNETKAVTIDDILKVVCKHFDLEPSAIHTKSRKREVVQARQIAMYLAKNHTDFSTSKIGKFIGNKDHATVLHACKTVKGQLEVDKSFNAEVQEIEALLTAFTPEEDVRPLLALENIFVDQDFSNKEQAIQFLCGNLGVNGRTEHPFELEEDVWQREEIVTTGVGFGVAIPHTKSQWIRHSSISIARLAKPIDWQSEMGEVELVIMLTLGANEGMNHVKVFSQLARKLVNKNFRQSLFAAQDAQSILTLLETELTF